MWPYTQEEADALNESGEYTSHAEMLEHLKELKEKRLESEDEDSFDTN